MARERHIPVLVECCPVHGPDGTGALYIRRELIPQIQPSKVGHHAAASYDLQGRWTPEAQSIKKFELTTTSGHLWAGLTAAIDFIQGIGLEAIQDRVRALSRLAVERPTSVPRVMVTSPQHPQLGSGLVSFSVDGASPQQVVAYLWRQGELSLAG